MREGKWKLHVPRAPDELGSIFQKQQDSITVERPMLYDLGADVGETTDVAAKHPEVVRRLLATVEKARKDRGAWDRGGEGARYFDPEPRRPDIAEAAAKSGK